MGLSWQQGPLSAGAIGRFRVPGPLPKRLLYAEQLRRRMRVRFGGNWIADSEEVVLPFEPARYPVGYFPEGDIVPAALECIDHPTQHADLGTTSSFAGRAGDQTAPRGAWQHIGPPAHRPARPPERTARTGRLRLARETQTFCPYEGNCSYYNIGDARLAAWSYPEAYTEVGRISDFMSFEPDKISVHLDGRQLPLGPGQTVIPHGVDRELTIAEVSLSHKR
ncbi:DUF427 domain-containing protein [Paraburkholderia sp. MMS20-SJTN17]|uniref:DUF427 domain-containing protein n=1 Tax=Paraburkholderia translucens TaxID=2886945 RepID=A0ABS8K8X0_9BURK|nr:DUF427 domain-containing protein [Paraburkholderia sp. MMS20-SJTN17]MCC8400902.1 DUF427 domain-containing protein [Paraburkholderia sp. MMS20-SJTN17]